MVFCTGLKVTMSGGIRKFSVDYGEMSEPVEGARLEIACTATKWYRGFESLSLRHFLCSGSK